MSTKRAVSLLLSVCLSIGPASAQDIFHSGFENPVGAGVSLSGFPDTTVSTVVDLGNGEGFLETHARKSATGEPLELIGLRIVSRDNSDLVLVLDSQGRPTQGVSNVESRKVVLTDYTATTVTLHFESPDGSRLTIPNVAYEDIGEGVGGELARAGRAMQIFASAIVAANASVAGKGPKWVGLAAAVTFAVIAYTTFIGKILINTIVALTPIASGEACLPQETSAQCINRKIDQKVQRHFPDETTDCPAPAGKAATAALSCRMSPDWNLIAHLLSRTSSSPGCEVTTDESYSYYADEDIPLSGIDCFDDRFGNARFNYFGTRTRASDGANFVVFYRPTPDTLWRYLNSGIVGGDQGEAELKFTNTAADHETRAYFNQAYNTGLSFFSQYFDLDRPSFHSIDYTCFDSSYSIYGSNGFLDGTGSCPIAIPLFPSERTDPFVGFWRAPALKCLASASSTAPSC